MLSHVPAARILVIAPDADMRQSLAFVFEANGLHVRTCTHWAPEEKLDQYDALVLDELALPRGFHADPALLSCRDKIVLLAGRIGAPPEIPHACLVRKPLLDSLVLDFVHALIGARSADPK